MKSNFIYPIVVAILTFFIFNSCKKNNNNIDPGCGCSTDSVWHEATYDNFGGFSYNAWLVYTTLNDQHASWYISVEIPNSNLGAICKICNPDLSAIRAFTDTSTRRVGIPVHFAGKLKKPCPNENWGGVTLPETLVADITIDSLKKN